MIQLTKPKIEDSSNAQNGQKDQDQEAPAKSYKCKICQKQFNMQSKLRFHIQIKHSKKTKDNIESDNKENVIKPKKISLTKPKDQGPSKPTKKTKDEPKDISDSKSTKKNSEQLVIHCPTCEKVFHNKAHYYTHDYIIHKGMRGRCNPCKAEFRPAMQSYETAKEKFKEFQAKHSACKTWVPNKDAFPF